MENYTDKKQQVKIELVDASADGRRIDNFLLKHLKGVPKSHLYKLMRKGQVRVNGKRVKPSQKLQLEDKVRIPPVRLSESKKPVIPAYWLSLFQDRTLFENHELLIINKPAGVSVHGGSEVEFGVIDILKAIHGNASNLSLVHRLDRDTSGCLIIAKNRKALLAVQDLFRSGSVRKEYLALTAGKWQAEIQTIDQPLKKNVLQGGERIVVIDPAGKSAVSHFYLVEQFRSASLMRVAIETGRTHQIRVHAQHAGHSVAGDRRYGDKSFNKSMREQGLQRLFLHAFQLEFSLDETISVECPLPDELSQFLAVLKA